MYRNIELPSTKTIISTAASVAATAMVVRSFAKDIFPPELRQFFFYKFHQILSTLNNDMTIIIEEFEGLNKNHLFHAAEIYMGTIINPSTRNFRASLSEKEKKINVSVGENEELVDKFDKVQLQWTMVTKQTKPRYVEHPDGYNTTMKCEVKQIMLKFHKKHKIKVIDEYFPYVLKRSKAIEEKKKTVKLHTLNNDRMYPRIVPWQSVNLDHPAKFETLAMDDEIKNMIIGDLDRFLARKEFYRKVGKAWKRGYLLFGPPGTGKSSLIAAIANYLNFDVYDLELTNLRCNSDLRRLLLSTANRSILVVEDIDASIDLTERKKTAAPKTPPQMNPFGQHTQTPKVTLSGLLNFIDGLWSSCGDERIIIFTTNHKEKLDPALLRPGRMDVHIHMSYCTPCSFKMLVSNYLSINEPHPLALEAQRLIVSTKVTPAEIAEQLLKSDNPDITLKGLIEFLQDKKESERTRREKLEVTKPEVLLDIKNDGRMDMKIVKGPENYGIQELIKMVKESPVELRENILNKNEIPPNDLRFLIGFLEEELENKSVKGFEALVRVQKTE